MLVRRLRADETAAYRDVRLRALLRAPEAFGSTYEESVARPDAVWAEFTLRLATSDAAAGFVLDRGDGRFAGLASVRLLEDGDAEINQMWLDEDVRGGAWAQALLDACHAAAVAMGAPRTTLWVVETNERARRLYLRSGYRPTGETAHMHEDDTGSPLELRLARPLS